MDTFGLIVYYRDPGTGRITYHLSQRRDSLAYIHFLQGRVPDDKLVRYFSLMTKDEKLRLTKYPFDILWADLFSYRHHGCRGKEEAAARFAWLSQGSPSRIEKALSECDTSITLEWSFPKGRKKREDEPDLVCAFREYREETHNRCYLDIVDTPPLMTEYTLGVTPYRTFYYLAKSKFQPPTRYYWRNAPLIPRKYVSDETGDLKWVVFDDALGLLPPRLHHILKQADQQIRALTEEVKGADRDSKGFISLQDGITKYQRRELPVGTSPRAEPQEFFELLFRELAQIDQLSQAELELVGELLDGSERGSPTEYLDPGDEPSDPES